MSFTINNKSSFTDSFPFISSSLGSLVKNLTQKIIHEDSIYFFYLICLGHIVPKYIFKKYLKKISTQRLDIVKNILIPTSPKCFNNFGELYILIILRHFNTKKYIGRLATFQNLCEF